MGIYKGEIFGNLWQTFNIDLEKYPGRIALAPKMKRYVSGLGVVHKFIRTNGGAVSGTPTDQWFGLCYTDIIRNGTTLIQDTNWVTDDTTGTFNDPLDGVVHEIANGEQSVIVTRPSDVAKLNTAGVANAWDDDWGTTVASITAPTTALTYRPCARLQRLVAIANKVTGVPRIDTVDKDLVVSNARLTFDVVYTVRLIYTSSNRFWIALQHDLGGKAKIIEWDGFSLTYNNEYELDGSYPMSGWVGKDDIPYFITETGQIFKFTGGGFEAKASFPNPDRRAVFSGTDATGESYIGPYGCFPEGDVVYINAATRTNIISATAMSQAARRLRAGVWIYNTKTGNFYHHMGIGEHASAGTDVNYGCSPLARVGAVIRDGNNLFTSAQVYIGGANWQASTQTGLYIDVVNNSQASSEGRNRGYFITPYIPAEEAEALWEAVRLRFKRFVNSGNRIILKWRTREPLFNASAQDQNTAALDVISAPATWASTTTFTCKVPTGVAVGDEVEILSGDNAGCCFNISAMSATPDNTTTITVTIDEAAPTSSTDTILVRFDNWRSETAISATDIGNKRVPLTLPSTVPNAGGTHGEFIQLKIELRGYDVQIDEILPIQKVKTKNS